MHWFPSNDFLKDFKLQDFVLSKLSVKSFNWAFVPFSSSCFWQLKKQELIVTPLCCWPAQSPRFSATHPSQTTDLSLLSAFVCGTTIIVLISLLQLTSCCVDPPILAGFSVPPFPTLIQWNPYCRCSRPPGMPRVRSRLSRAAQLTSLVGSPLPSSAVISRWGHHNAEFQHPCRDRNDSHTLIQCTVDSRFIGLLAWLYTFSISVHAITLIRIDYRHKSRAVHAPHIPLELVSMH